MTIKNTGEGYEALTEQVFIRLLAQDNVCTDVERDVYVQGKGARHQLDVTFTFSLGGVSYRTIVQCKDWKSPVKQEQVLAFRSVLDDIPGQPRGIMVSRGGFQKGAREFAKHHGIQLYELRPPRDEDWDGLFRRVEIEGRLYAPEFRNGAFTFDRSWLMEQLTNKGIPNHELNLTVLPGIDEACLETGEAFDLKTMLNAYVPSAACDWTPIHHEFQIPVMVSVNDYYVPRIRVTAVDAELRVTELQQTITIAFDHLVAFCFRDVLAGTQRFLNADGGPLGGTPGAPA